MRSINLNSSGIARYIEEGLRREGKLAPDEVITARDEWSGGWTYRIRRAVDTLGRDLLGARKAEESEDGL